jgi:gas vesicle protein
VRRCEGWAIAALPLQWRSACYKKSSFSRFAFSFILGTLTGAAVALLYAPMTGKKMQKKFADATEKVKDVVEDSVDNVQNVLRKVANA